MTEDFLICGLTAVDAVVAVPACRMNESDVVLFMADEFDDDVLVRMADLAWRSERNRPIVLVCSRPSTRHVVKAVDYGLVGVVEWPKDGVAGLVQAVRAAQNGHAELPPDIVWRILQKMRSMGTSSSPCLQVSAREVAVIRLLADGFGTPEIARKLNFSDRTIKNIVAGLSGRFGLRNRTHLVAFAMRNEIA